MKRNNKRIKVPSLPKEIIHEEILSRLPVKSLLRFRCVSKSWRSLIGSKRFIKTQHQNSTQNPSFPKQRVILHKTHGMPRQCSLQSLLIEEEKPIDPSPLDVTTNTLMVTSQVLGCYNGLVCVWKFPRKFYLWNPSTRISKKLPQMVSGMFCIQNCGFGWDESSGEYKVFALVHDYNVPSCRGRLYSSKTNSWKTIEYNFTDLPYFSNEAGVFVGGKLHWKDTTNNDIFFLDLKSEVFGRIPLPRDHGNNRLGQTGGCLCVHIKLQPNPWRDFRVWVMKESWERLMDLSLDHELLQSPFSTSFIQKGSDGKIFVFDGSTLLIYDPRDNVFNFPEICQRYGSHHVYVESLVSPEDV